MDVSKVMAEGSGFKNVNDVKRDPLLTLFRLGRSWPPRFDQPVTAVTDISKTEY